MLYIGNFCSRNGSHFTPHEVQTLFAACRTLEHRSCCRPPLSLSTPSTSLRRVPSEKESEKSLFPHSILMDNISSIPTTFLVSGLKVSLAATDPQPLLPPPTLQHEVEQYGAELHTSRVERCTALAEWPTPGLQSTSAAEKNVR